MDATTKTCAHFARSAGTTGEDDMYRQALLVATISAAAFIGSAGEMQAAGLGQFCGGFFGVPCDAGLRCYVKPPVFPDKGGTCVRAKGGKSYKAKKQ